MSRSYRIDIQDPENTPFEVCKLKENSTYKKRYTLRISMVDFKKLLSKHCIAPEFVLSHDRLPFEIKNIRTNQKRTFTFLSEDPQDKDVWFMSQHNDEELFIRVVNE